MLSKDMQQVLDDMRIYLMSAGKSDREIEGIMDELTVHAEEGERDGKSVRQIFGDSPKAYVQEISKELSSRPMEIAQIVFIIFLGAVSYFIFNDAVHDSLEYSLYVLAGYPIYLLLGAVLTSFLGRISAFKAKKTAVLYMSIYSIFMFSSILAIIFADRVYGTPVLSIDGAGRWLIMGLSFICIVLVSFWAKVKVLAALPVLLAGVHVMFQVLGWDSEAWGIAEAYIPYIGLVVLMAFEAKRSKKTAEYE